MTTEGKLRAATVGCGRMGAFASHTAATWTPSFWQPIAHLDAISKLESMRIVGAVDIDPATRQKVESHYRTKCYGDVADLFAEQDVDIVTIATRTPEKTGVIRAALKNGVRAFHIEKPLCNSVAEMEELKALLADRPVTYGCFRRYLSPYRDLSTIAARYDLGALTQLQVNAGNGLLYWSHPHSVDMMLMANQSGVASVRAILDVPGGKPAYPLCIDDPTVSWAVIEFVDGTVGCIGSMPGSDMVAGYERGTLAIEADGRNLVLRSHKDQDPYLTARSLPIDITRGGGTSAPLSLLADALRGDETALAEVDSAKDDMFLGQAMLFGILQSSANNGAPVRLEDLDADIVCQAMYRGRPA